MTGSVVGLDIGGAHVKAADTLGRATTRAFAIWREPDRLADVLRETLASFGEFRLLAVTTTAELADCFRTKAEGVAAVLNACEEVSHEQGAGLAVWQTAGEFVTPAVAREFPLLTAAANWHAQATWLGRLVPRGRGLLIDVGSTTTDLVPLADGLPDPYGLTDVERLLAGELVYTGVGRTPVFHVAATVPLRGGRCPLVPELFATMLDAHVLEGSIADDPNDDETANGRPATREFARERLARVVCCDTTELGESELDAIARELSDSQIAQFARAVERICRERGPFGQIVVSGSGMFLAERALDQIDGLHDVPRTRLADCFDTATASAACARAVAELAVERRADLLSDFGMPGSG